MLNLKAVAGLVLICLVVLSFPPFVNAVDSESSPSQVVEQWLTVYPKDLDSAATLTTINLRDGWSQKEWVRTKKPLLAMTELRSLNGEILSEEITGMQG